GRGRGGRGPGSRLGGSCARLADAAGRGTWLPPHDPSAGAVAAVGIIDRLLVGRPALIGVLQELRRLGRAVRGGAVASLGVMPGPKEFEHTGRRRLDAMARLVAHGRPRELPEPVAGLAFFEGPPEALGHRLDFALLTTARVRLRQADLPRRWPRPAPPAAVAAGEGPGS